MENPKYYKPVEDRKLIGVLEHKDKGWEASVLEEGKKVIIDMTDKASWVDDLDPVESLEEGIVIADGTRQATRFVRLMHKGEVITFNLVQLNGRRLRPGAPIKDVRRTFEAREALAEPKEEDFDDYGKFLEARNTFRKEVSEANRERNERFNKRQGRAAVTQALSHGASVDAEALKLLEL